MKKIYLTLFAMTMASQAWAQETPLLEPISVEGRTEALEQRALAPATKVVVEREEITRMEDRTVGDVLRRLPGISYSGPPGVTKDVRMRGMDKGYTQILINGERMNSAKPDRQMQVSRIPADMIERIEIIRTPTADLDSQGIGGTINIILKEAEQKPFAQIRLGGGYTGEIPDGEKPIGEVSGQIGGSKGNFSYLLNASLLERAENKGDENRKYKADGSLKETSTKTDNSDVRDTTLAPRFSWQTAVGKLSLDPFYVRTREDKVKDERKFKADGSANGRKVEDEDKVNEIARLRLAWERPISDAFTLSWRGTAQQASEDNDKATRELNPDDSLKKTGTEDKLNEETEFSTAVETLWRANDFHTMKIGLELQDRTSEAEKSAYENGALKAADAKGVFTIDEQRWTLYGSDEWLIGEKHLLTPGLRLELYETDAEQTGGATNSSDGTEVNPSLQYRYQWTDETVLRAGVARTLRLANFDELNPFLSSKDGTLTKPDIGGNPELEPETAIGYDVGVERFFAGRKGVVGANLFFRDISDLIEPVTTLENGRYVSRPENVGDGELWGAEFDLSRRLDFIDLPNLTLWGNYTWLDSEVRAADGTTRPMVEVPDYIFNIGFDQEIPEWGFTFGAALNVLGPMETEKPKDNLTEVKSESRKELVDIYARKSFENGWNLSLTAYNIFEDDKFRDSNIVNPDGSLKERETRLETSVRTIMFTLEKRF